jgi:hypothetical protein
LSADSREGVFTTCATGKEHVQWLNIRSPIGDHRNSGAGVGRETPRREGTQALSAEGGEYFRCANIVRPAENHPAGIDVVIRY